MTALLIVLGVLLFLFILLLIPLRLSVWYDLEMTVFVRYLFLKWQLVPEPEKKPKKEKKTAKAPEHKKEPAKPRSLLDKVKDVLRAEGFQGFMRLVKDFLQMTGGTLKELLKRASLRHFDLYVMTGGEDAAEAAILYGQTSAAVYAAAEVLFTLTKCRDRRVTVDLDYSIKSPYVKLAAEGGIRPLFLLYFGVKYLLRAFPILKRFQ